MKMRRPHKVPLSRQSLGILRQVHDITGNGQFVFPGFQSLKRPMSENALNGALRRLGYSGDEMTSHGFRSMRTYAATRRGGRIRRWVFRPLFGIADNWNAFSARAPDPHVFAALRVFGYVGLTLVSLALIAVLIYAAIVITLTALFFWFALTVVGRVLNYETGAPHRGGNLGGIDPLLGGGKRGSHLRRGRRGLLNDQKTIGRIDDQGNIFRGRGGMFDQEEKIGRIDEDGAIYEGKGGWFGREEKIGRRDANGDVYQSGKGWSSPEEKVGRAADDGTIFRGTGSWTGPEEEVGGTD